MQREKEAEAFLSAMTPKLMESAGKTKQPGQAKAGQTGARKPGMPGSLYKISNARGSGGNAAANSSTPSSSAANSRSAAIANLSSGIQRLQQAEKSRQQGSSSSSSPQTRVLGGKSPAGGSAASASGATVNATPKSSQPGTIATSSSTPKLQNGTLSQPAPVAPAKDAVGKPASTKQQPLDQTDGTGGPQKDDLRNTNTTAVNAANSKSPSSQQGITTTPVEQQKAAQDLQSASKFSVLPPKQIEISKTPTVTATPVKSDPPASAPAPAVTQQAVATNDSVKQARAQDAQTKATESSVDDAKFKSQQEAKVAESKASPAPQKDLPTARSVNNSASKISDTKPKEETSKTSPAVAKPVTTSTSVTSTTTTTSSVSGSSVTSSKPASTASKPATASTVSKPANAATPVSGGAAASFGSKPTSASSLAASAKADAKPTPMGQPASVNVISAGGGANKGQVVGGSVKPTTTTTTTTTQPTSVAAVSKPSAVKPVFKTVARSVAKSEEDQRDRSAAQGHVTSSTKPVGEVALNNKTQNTLGKTTGGSDKPTTTKVRCTHTHTHTHTHACMHGIAGQIACDEYIICGMRVFS